MVGVVIDDILKRIYDEQPAWWPFGLRRSMMDRAFVIHDPDSQQPAGFTGWQFRGTADKPEAYYAVGLLPEYRGKGLAQAALSEMFRDHTPPGHTIKAYIVPGNTASTRLAERLGVPVQHKAASLHGSCLPPTVSDMTLSKEAALSPRRYSGVAMQQYLPLSARRTRFSPAEDAAIAQGQSQWLPALFTSMADSPAVDMHSPGKAALMAALLGGGAGAGVSHIMGGSTGTTAGVGGVAALLSALAAYHSTQANNEGIEEMMRRIPTGGTRRDMLSDPVLQADRDRQAQSSASTEALRTAQMLAALQAVKQSSVVKQANGLLGALGRAFRATGSHLSRHSNTYIPWTAGAGGAAAWDQLSHNFDNTHWNPSRVGQGLLNAAILGIAANKNSYGGDVVKRLQSTLMVPTKDVLVAAAPLLDRVSGVLPEASEAMRRSGTSTSPEVNINSPSSLDTAASWVRENPGLAAGGALTGLGLLTGGGMLARDALKSLIEATDREGQGRIKVTLPTRRPGDVETALDIPVRSIDLSPALFGRLRRDVKAKLHSETKERTRHVNLTPEERARRAAVLATYR